MILRAIAKDVELLLRDRGTLISLFALPIIFMLAFGAVFARDPGAQRGTQIAVWSAPGDARGAAIERAFAEVPGYELSVRADAASVRTAVATDDAAAGLVIPPESSEPIELVIDLAAPLQVRGPLQYGVESIVARALAPPSAPEVRIEARAPPGAKRPLADITSFQITVPGNAVLFGFFIALTVAMAFSADRRTGTWRRLLAAPIPRWKVLGATLVPYFVIGLCQLAFLFGVGVLVFGMQIAGSVLALVALSVAVVTCAVSLGLLFAALGGSEKQLGAIGSVVLLVMGVLGGCMVPRLAMPSFMKALGLAVPHGWALDGYYDVLVRQGTTLQDVALPIAALLAFAAAFVALGLALFRFEQ